MSQNTKITYRYTDHAGYSAQSHIILEGTLSVAEIGEIISCLDNNSVGIELGTDELGYFIPGQIGLDDIQDLVGNPGRPWDEDDHPFHALIGIEKTDEAPTMGRTAAWFAEQIQKTRWDWSYERPDMGSDQGYGM